MSTNNESPSISVTDSTNDPKTTLPLPRPGPGARLPSLTQLAARQVLPIISSSAHLTAMIILSDYAVSLLDAMSRISPNAPTPTSSSNRPRLATSILRSDSRASTLTTGTAHSGDSTAVNPPSTRPVSPTASERSLASGTLSATLDASATGSIPPEGIPAPIVDKEEKLIRGYKNIPSLTAITERMRRTKLENSQNASGSAATIVITAPQNAVTTPTTEAPVPVSNQEAEEEPTEEEHPLQHTWTLYHDTKAKMPFTPFTPGHEHVATTPVNTEGAAYEAGLTTVGEFKTVEGFCRYFNWLKPPSKLERSSNYHLFKDGIKPMWEDPANSNGGKWALTIKSNPQLLDRCWSWLAMALVGEELDEKDEVCGAVVSLRAKIDRIQLWTRGKDDVEAINNLGRKLIKLLDVSDEPGVGLEFQYNTEDRPTLNKFISIQTGNTAGYRPSPLTATSTTFASTFSPSKETSPLAPTSASSQGPVLPLKAQNVAALDAATGAGGAFGAWRSKRVQPGDLPLNLEPPLFATVMIQTSLLQSTHADLVTDAAYDFYGLRLATCSLDQRIKIWTLDETTGNWNNDSDWKAHDAPVSRLSWAHPEFGTILASCSFDRTVKIWEEGGMAGARGGEGNTGSKWHERAILSESRVTGASVRAIEFSPRLFGLKLAVLSSDSCLRVYDCLELHNLATWTVVIEIDVQMMHPPPTPPMSGADMFGAPGTSLGSSNGQSYGSSVGAARPGKREADGGWAVSWCKDKIWGQLLAVASGTSGIVKVLHFNEARSHRTAFTLPHNTSGLTDTGAAPAVTTVAWAPSCGRRYHLIATGGRDGKVKIWKITPPAPNLRGDGEWIVNQAGTFDEHQFPVTRVEWNVTGTVLSSAGNDGNIRLWKATFAGQWRSMGHIHTDHGDEEGIDDMQD